MKLITVALIAAALTGCDSVDFQLEGTVEGEQVTKVYPTLVECSEALLRLKEEIKQIKGFDLEFGNKVEAMIDIGPCRPVPSDKFKGTLNDARTIYNAYQED